MPRNRYHSQSFRYTTYLTEENTLKTLKRKHDLETFKANEMNIDSIF